MQINVTHKTNASPVCVTVGGECNHADTVQDEYDFGVTAYVNGELDYRDDFRNVEVCKGCQMYREIGDNYESWEHSV